jgi:hypothetical protein
MDQAFQMLGREHEADLEREAEKWHRADAVRRASRAPAAASDHARGRKRVRFIAARAVGFIARVSRVEA